MILTCPSCGTRYVVKDGAIPPGGRTVRCAQCKHSWHQDPEEMSEEGAGTPVAPGEPDGAPEAQAAAPADEPVQHIPEYGSPEAEPEAFDHHPLGDDSRAAHERDWTDHAHPDVVDDAPVDEEETVLPEPEPEHQPAASSWATEVTPEAEVVDYSAAAMPREAAEAEQPYPEEVVPVEASAPEPLPETEPLRSSHPLRAGRLDNDADYTPYAAADEEPAPRRRWPLILLVVLVLVALVAAGLWFFAPSELKNRLGIAQANGETPLLVQVRQHSRQELASGNQLLEVSGMVINPTDQPQTVPPLNAQLRSLEQQVVYKWTIPPPAPRLAPGGSASFNSANLNIPPAAACLEVFFGRQQRPPVCRDSAAVGA